jgi:sialidase-1
MEGVVTQLSDGRVMMNIRNESEVHRRAVAFSPNGVTDWTVLKFEPQLHEPICFGSLLAVPREVAGRAGVLLFSNPDNVAHHVEIGPTHYCDCRNVTVKLSLNDGTDWEKSLAIWSVLVARVRSHFRANNPRYADPLEIHAEHRELIEQMWR